MSSTSARMYFDTLVNEINFVSVCNSRERERERERVTIRRLHFLYMWFMYVRLLVSLCVSSICS